MARILIADHLAERRNILGTFLRADEHSIIPIAREAEAVKMMREIRPDIVILEGTVGGIKLLGEAKEMDSRPAILMLMATAPSPEQFVELLEQGIDEILVSPLDINDVLTKTQRALSRHPASDGLPIRFPDLVGSCEKMQQVFRRIVKAASADHPVFIVGEPGSGKQLVAKQIHLVSARRNREFRAVHCAGVSDSDLESELFGHEPGVFPRALERRHGALESSEGGTVYLDEVSSLTVLLQMKLFNFLEEKKLQRMGGANALSADVRIVAGTSRPINRLLEPNEFRADLFYRLSVCQIELPPLKARPLDIPDLVAFFLGHYDVQIAGEAVEVLMNYSWPGSVEELKNAVEQSVNACENNRVELRDLPVSILKSVAVMGRKYKFTPGLKP